MIKTFNITKEYSKELEYLEQQYNQSRYLCELIRADMNKQQENNQIVELVREALQSPQTNVHPTKVGNNVKHGDETKKKQGAMSLLS